MPLGAGLFSSSSFPTFLHQWSVLNQAPQWGTSLSECCESHKNGCLAVLAGAKQAQIAWIKKHWKYENENTHAFYCRQNKVKICFTLILQGKAWSGSSSWIHLLARSRPGNHLPLSLNPCHFFKYWHKAFISEVKGPEQLPIMLICHRNND